MESSARFSTGCARGDGVRWGDSIQETIDEAIRTYKCEVEKMNEKVEKLERAYM